MQSSPQSGHSADVRISLVLHGHSIPVAQLGPGFLLLDAPTDLPPGVGIMHLSVDLNERSWGVTLPEGISAKSKRVKLNSPGQ